MGMYDVSMLMSVLGFVWVLCLPTSMCVWDDVVHVIEVCKSKRNFRFLIFNLSCHVELLFLPCFIASWT